MIHCKVWTRWLCHWLWFISHPSRLAAADAKRPSKTMVLPQLLLIVYPSPGTRMGHFYQ